jgi:hypothetical protein
MRSFECELPKGGELQLLGHLIQLRAKLTIGPSGGRSIAEDWTIEVKGESSRATVLRRRDMTHINFTSVAIFDYLDEMISRKEPGYKWVWPIMDQDSESREDEQPGTARNPLADGDSTSD